MYQVLLFKSRRYSYKGSINLEKISFLDFFVEIILTSVIPILVFYLFCFVLFFFLTKRGNFVQNVSFHKTWIYEPNETIKLKSIEIGWNTKR